MASKTLLLLGYTGETGKHCLNAALARAEVSSVVCAGRRAPDGITSQKLKVIEIDFDKLVAQDSVEMSKLKDVQADGIICTLGTTRAAAGSAEAFTRIDKEYVLAAARAARNDTKPQTFTYCSSAGSSSSSFFLYPKSKGQTEEGIAAVGYDQTVIFRPGLLAVPGGRGEARLMESIAAKATGFLSRFSHSIEIKTPILGSAIVRATLEGRSSYAQIGKEEALAGHKAWVLGNADALKIGSEP